VEASDKKTFALYNPATLDKIADGLNFSFVCSTSPLEYPMEDQWNSS
jgi:hypothetical protein